jgi:penicillin-binding protein 1A
MEKVGVPNATEVNATTPWRSPRVTVGQAQEPVVSDDSLIPPFEARTAPCNIPVCQQFYHSFRPSDCTYQPYWGGPRQFCER